MKTKCAKKSYRTKEDAVSAAYTTFRFGIPALSPWGAYRCDQCKFDSGQRAWHWGNRRPRKR